MKYKTIAITLLVMIAANFSFATDKTTDENFDAKKFKNVPMEYKPVPFWSWNEVMTPDEVRRQIDLIDKGFWGGGFVHSRIGLITPYLGDEWFKAVDVTIEECKKRDMIVWLYDEDRWPSGFSGGTVPLADEKFRMKYLVARKGNEPAPKEAVKLGEPVNGIQVYKCTRPLGDMGFNGTTYIDTMYAPAVKKFIDDAYESYYKRYKQYYGNVIRAEFTDEPCPLNRGTNTESGVAFTEGGIEEFIKMHGYDPTSKLHLLFSDGEGAYKLRLDWYAMINKLFEENFSKQIGEWCRERNIALTGHYIIEGSLQGQQEFGANVMRQYRWQGMPGIDQLGKQINERLTPLQCRSVKNQFGQKRMLSELYGCAGGALSFEDRKWIGLQNICLGVNLLNPHLALYTMSGCRKRDYPQNIFYQQSWWQHNRVIDEPLSRYCYATAQGECASDILLLHPGISARMLMKTEAKRVKDAMSQDARKKISEVDKKYTDLINVLLGEQLMFDLGDEDVIESVASIEGKDFKVNLMKYKMVIIPHMLTMKKSTFELLKKFHNAGGILFKTDDALKMIEGEDNADLQKFLAQVPMIEAEKLPDAIREKNPASVQLADNFEGNKKLVWTQVRNMPNNERLVLIVNLDRFKKMKGDVLFRGDYTRARRLNEVTGEISDLYSVKTKDGLIVPFEMDKVEGHLVMLDKGKSEAKKIETKEIARHEVRAWRIKRMDENSMTLDFAKWKESGDEKLSNEAAPIIEIQKYLNSSGYNGELVLSYPFDVEGLKKDRDVKLVIEHPERCDIFVNGKKVEYAGLPFWRDIRWMPIDIKGMLVDGENNIELRYKNFQYANRGNYKDQAARYGTEIESLYLIGDFSVACEVTGQKPFQRDIIARGLPVPSVKMAKKDSLKIVETQIIHNKGDITVQGLPFYAGRISYFRTAKDLAVPEGARAYLTMENLDCPVAEVFVNGKKSGAFSVHPLKVDITDNIQDGRADIEIVFYATLRNLLGPHHFSAGEHVGVSPNSFTSSLGGKHTDMKKILLDWSKQTPSNWNNDYCILGLGETGKTYVVIEKSEETQNK